MCIGVTCSNTYAQVYTVRITTSTLKGRRKRGEHRVQLALVRMDVRGRALHVRVPEGLAREQEVLGLAIDRGSERMPQAVRGEAMQAARAPAVSFVA